jgi:hypothetical protein
MKELNSLNWCDIGEFDNKFKNRNKYNKDVEINIESIRKMN